jgi:molecular chaperone GrpE
MAEAENKMNEQPGTEPEEIMDETAEKAADETAEKAAGETAAETADETVEETMDEAGAEEAAEETSDSESNAEKSAEEPEGQAPAGSKEKAFQDKVAALEDKVKRQMAEFDNFRKRTAKEKEQMFSMGEKNVIEKMLPVVDNFERGLAAVPENEKDSAIVSGMEMVYKQLMKQLEDLGVKPIEAVGKEFDPNFHNAVMQVESDEFETGIVAQEFQKGYTYHDVVVRHSMVGVVR